jgi:PAS domain S-box-containing protein
MSKHLDNPPAQAGFAIESSGPEPDSAGTGAAEVQSALPGGKGAADARLEVSERYLRQAQRIARLGHWRWNAEARGLTEWSEEYAAILGLTHEAIDPTDEGEIRHFHPEDRDRVLKTYAAANTEAIEFELSYRIVRPDGEVRYVHEIGEPEFDRFGKFVGQFGTIQDVTERATAEIRLLEREAQLSEAQKQANLGYWRWSVITDELTYYSEETRRIVSGWMDLGASTNAQMYANVHPDERERVFRQMDAADAEGTDYEIEYRVVLPDGEIRHMREMASAEFDSENRFIGQFGTIQDITDLRRVEESLGRSEARLADFAEAASDWLWEMDGSLRFSYLSSGFEAKSGIDRTTWLGRARWELPGVDLDGEPWRALVARLETHQHFRDMRVSYVDAAGERHHLRISGRPVIDADGTFSGYRGVATDETREVLERQTRVTLQQRFLDALDSTSDAIALCDPQDRLVLYNRNFQQCIEERVPGVLRPGIIFEDFIRDIARGGYYDIARENLERFIEHRLYDHRNVPSRRVHHLGDGQWSQVEEFPTREGGVIQIRRDITEQVLRENELVAAKDQAEVASRAKTEFLANMSHELRTPLNAILGFSEVISSEVLGPVEERYLEYVRDIHASGLHLLALISDILDLSKIEAGKFELNEENVDIPDLVEGSMRLVENLAAGAGIRFDVEIPRHGLSIRADSRKIKQIMINLLSNAITFTSPGGRIDVRVGVDSNGCTFLEIGDTGAGMTAEEVERAIEPFVQLEDVTSRLHEGSGLGLSLAKALTEQHQGELRIESVKGEGTRVLVILPADRTVPDGS